MTYQEPIKSLVYEFFFKITRFEYSLKINGYVTSNEYRIASTDWNRFIRKFQNTYRKCESATSLLDDPPKVQVVDTGGSLFWENLKFNKSVSDLHKVLVIVRTIRNNLFHGGKHGEGAWDNEERLKELLENAILVIDDLAGLEIGIDDEYSERY